MNAHLASTTRRVGRAVVAAIALALAGCGDKESKQTAATGVFVGRVAASQAYIALVSDGKRVTGYLCDSRKLATWLADANLDSSRTTLRSRAGDRLGVAVVEQGAAAGWVVIDGKTHTFRATPASGDAGLYCLGKRAWIKLADRSVRGTDVHPMQTFKDSKPVTSFPDAA
jgi:hypothetical protein